MKFGLFHSVQWPEGSDQRQRYREGLEEAIHAEEVGFESVWLTEHHFSRHGIVSDSLNVLSHLAARTTNLRLGTAVAVLPFHDPVRLAEAAATVDVLSNGRLDFGVGRGYQWGEFHGFGVPMEERADRFEESIDLIQRSWDAREPFAHEGRFWRYGDIDPQPKPVQRPRPPIWVATDSEEGLRRCAEEDWGVMLPQGRSMDVVGEQVGRYRKVLAEAGKPFNAEKILLARALYVAPSDEQAWADAGDAYIRFRELATKLAASPQGKQLAHNPFDHDSLRDAVVFGGPETCLSMLRRIEELGIQQVIFFVHFGGLAHEKIMASMDRFAAEVVPLLRKAGTATAR
ncbi:MAG: LLM class flavin-dependent oxidoreductase [Dehalococcoidia bacterium]|nr:LLM class flavin-dependent oxidoreductase [Dehalococcoidia bacterium]